MQYFPPRPRKSRRRDYSRATSNPLRDADIEVLREWADSGFETADPEALERVKAALKRPTSDESYTEAIQEFFPAGKGQRELKPDILSKVLGRHDILTRVRSDYDAGKNKSAELAAIARLSDSQDEDVLQDPEYRNIVSASGELSATDVFSDRGIHAIRHRSRQEGRAITASGALSRMYRNSPRLIQFEPPREVLANYTAWILIGPAISGHPARVMTFRNGAHIDCDMVATTNFPLSQAIAKSIESMALWLAEKRSRQNRIQFVNLYQIGGKTYRTLWQEYHQGVPFTLSAESMLNIAYSQNAPARQVPWLQSVNQILDRYRSALLHRSRPAPYTESSPEPVQPVRAAHAAQAPVATPIATLPPDTSASTPAGKGKGSKKAAAAAAPAEPEVADENINPVDVQKLMIAQMTEIAKNSGKEPPKKSTVAFALARFNLASHAANIDKISKIHDDLRERVAKVLEAIKDGNTSREDIAGVTGVAASSIEPIKKYLIAIGELGKAPAAGPG